MQEQIQRRLEELRREFETGQGRLRDLEEQQAQLQQTVLRISGAIQVLEELMGDTDEPEQSDTEPTGQANDGVAAGMEQATGEDGLSLTAEK